MRHRLLTLAIAAALATPVAAQTSPAGGATAAVPLNYVGTDTRVSLGIDERANLEGEAFHVFADDDDSAWIGQGWLGQSGAGGLKLDYHWLWAGKGVDDSVERSEAVSVAKVFVAVDRNASEDRKLTVGAGVEREDFFLDAYVSAGLTDARESDVFVDVRNNTITGVQAGRPFTQAQTITTTTRSFEKAYDHGVGARAGRYFDAGLARLRAGVDYEWGDFSSNQLTFSLGADKFFSNSSHSLSLELEHYRRDGDFVLDDAQTRTWLFWRYDIGSSFRPSQPFRKVEVAREVAVETASQPVLVRNELRIDAESFFEFDRAQLTASARATLSEMIERLKATKRISRIEVAGHTCDLGPVAYNQALSERRAAAVRDFLAAAGIDSAEIDVVGNGETAPRYPNTRDQRMRNRRVDIGFLSVEESSTTAPPIRSTQRVVEWVQEPVKAPAPWIERALRNPAEHKRTVDVYRFERVAQATTLGPVQFINRPPVAVNDAAGVLRNSAAAPINVLGNDSDPDNDVLRITAVSTPANGSTAIAGSAVTYAPRSGFIGVDTFTYTISDGNGGSAQATVTVTVTAPPQANRPPVAVDDNASTPLAFAVVVRVLDNDFDPDGDPLTVVSATPGIRGQTRVNADGTVTYTPNVDWCGTDFFSYTIRDPGGLTATARAFVRRGPGLTGNADNAKACPI